MCYKRSSARSTWDFPAGSFRYANPRNQPYLHETIACILTRCNIFSPHLLQDVKKCLYICSRMGFVLCETFWQHRSVMLILVIWEPEKFYKSTRVQEDGTTTSALSAWTASLFPLCVLGFSQDLQITKRGIRQPTLRLLYPHSVTRAPAEACGRHTFSHDERKWTKINQSHLNFRYYLCSKKSV